MSEIFTAELTVAERHPRHDQQLAEVAIGWFGGPVRRLSLDVSVVEVDGLTRYLMQGASRWNRPAGLANDPGCGLRLDGSAS